MLQALLCRFTVYPAYLSYSVHVSWPLEVYYKRIMAVLCHAGFTALGDMAKALARIGAESVMGPLLPRVADQIKEAIAVKGRARPNCPEALQVKQDSSSDLIHHRNSSDCID